MAWYLAPALQQLRAQINAMFSGRDRLSDGSVGDTAHSARVSDHNPARDSVPPGIVRAYDIDEDLWGRNAKDPGAIAQPLADALVNDPRVAYVIYEGQIGIRNAKTGRVVWSKYNGANAHRLHIHVSLRHGRVFEQDTSPWPMPGLVGVIRPGVGADITPTPSEEDDMTPAQMAELKAHITAEVQTHAAFTSGVKTGEPLVDSDGNPATLSDIRRALTTVWRQNNATYDQGERMYAADERRQAWNQRQQEQFQTSVTQRLESSGVDPQVIRDAVAGALGDVTVDATLTLKS